MLFLLHPECVCVSRITCSWTQKVSVLSFFHQASPCDSLAGPLYFPQYSKGEIRLKKKKKNQKVYCILICSVPPTHYISVSHTVLSSSRGNIMSDGWMLPTFCLVWTRANSSFMGLMVIFMDSIGVVKMIIASPLAHHKLHEIFSTSLPHVIHSDFCGASAKAKWVRDLFRTVHCKYSKGQHYSLSRYGLFQNCYSYISSDTLDSRDSRTFY